MNCDHETAYALELAGAKAFRVHINSLLDGSVLLEDFHIIVLSGGFSWGDDHGAGVLQSVRLKTHMQDSFVEFVKKGNLILGICNGFQTLVNMGLLPGFNDDYQHRSIALTYNDCGNFRDQWVSLKVNTKSPCVFTKGLAKGLAKRFECMDLPVRHGEGKFLTDEPTLRRLVSNNQIVLQYANNNNLPANGEFPFNPNGSLLDIAGICDPSGRIFGLMPHPEAFNHWTNHPNWPFEKERLKRLGNKALKSPTSGMQLFKTAVDFIKNR